MSHVGLYHVIGNGNEEFLIKINRMVVLRCGYFYSKWIIPDAFRVQNEIVVVHRNGGTCPLIPEKIRTAPQTREMTVMRWAKHLYINNVCAYPLSLPSLSPALSGQRAVSPCPPDHPDHPQDSDTVTAYPVFGSQSISHSLCFAERSMYAHSHRSVPNVE